MSELETKMIEYLSRLYLLEKMEAGDEFYVEVGQDFKEDLEALFTPEQVLAAKADAEQQFQEISEEDEEDD